MTCKAQLKLILEKREGRSRAITSRELSFLTGQPDRKIRILIEKLISEGLPVISATERPAGYFIPTSLDEAKQYTQSLRSRAVEIFLRRKRVIKNTALYLKPAEQGKLL